MLVERMHNLCKVERWHEEYGMRCTQTSFGVLESVIVLMVRIRMEYELQMKENMYVWVSFSLK